MELSGIKISAHRTTILRSNNGRSHKNRRQLHAQHCHRAWSGCQHPRGRISPRIRPIILRRLGSRFHRCPAHEILSNSRTSDGSPKQKTHRRRPQDFHTHLQPSRHLQITFTPKQTKVCLPAPIKNAPKQTFIYHEIGTTRPIPIFYIYISIKTVLP